VVATAGFCLNVNVLKGDGQMKQNVEKKEVVVDARQAGDYPASYIMERVIEASEVLKTTLDENAQPQLSDLVDCIMVLTQISERYAMGDRSDQDMQMVAVMMPKMAKMQVLADTDVFSTEVGVR